MAFSYLMAMPIIFVWKLTKSWWWGWCWRWRYVLWRSHSWGGALKVVTPTSQWPHLRLLIVHTDHDDVRFRGSFPILTDKNHKLAYFGVLESFIYSTFCGTWGLLSYMYVILAYQILLTLQECHPKIFLCFSSVSIFRRETLLAPSLRCWQDQAAPWRENHCTHFFFQDQLMEKIVLIFLRDLWRKPVLSLLKKSGSLLWSLLSSLCRLLINFYQSEDFVLALFLHKRLERTFFNNILIRRG